ncbi:MAG: AgmX/PglI C-terminal domain-containing protein [Myxococcota bacterium]
MNNDAERGVEHQLDRWLMRLPNPEPDSALVSETLAWIDGDLTHLGGWVPPLGHEETGEPIGACHGLGALAWRERIKMPAAALGCFVLFGLSTAVAVSETRATEGARLGFGEIDTLDGVFRSGGGRFATFMMAPPDPSERSQRLRDKLQRFLDDSPGAGRTIREVKSELGARRSRSDVPAARANVEPGALNTDLRFRDGLAQDEIHSVIDAHRRELRFCYDSELRRSTGIRTRIELHWTIAPDGSVVNVVTSRAEPRWPALELCLARAIQSWRFPRPQAGATVDVNYPVTFRPVVH